MISWWVRKPFSNTSQPSNIWVWNALCKSGSTDTGVEYVLGKLFSQEVRPEIRKIMISSWIWTDYNQVSNSFHRSVRKSCILYALHWRTRVQSFSGMLYLGQLGRSLCFHWTITLPVAVSRLTHFVMKIYETISILIWIFKHIPTNSCWTNDIRILNFLAMRLTTLMWNIWLYKDFWKHEVISILPHITDQIHKVVVGWLTTLQNVWWITTMLLDILSIL